MKVDVDGLVRKLTAEVEQETAKVKEQSLRLGKNKRRQTVLDYQRGVVAGEKYVLALLNVEVANAKVKEAFG